MAGTIDWTVAAAIASAISALMAAISAFLSFSSMKRASRIAREQRASQATMQFIDLSLKHKKLSTSKPNEDYEWYVIGLLEWAREVLIAYPDDLNRKSQVKTQLRYHRDEFSRWGKDEWGDFGPDVARLIQEILNEPATVGLERK